MDSSPEALVRKFFATWANPSTEELAAFFADDAVWVDGPQGVRHGAHAISSELASQLAVGGSTEVEIKTLLSEAATVMVEEVSTFTIAEASISAVVMAVFEFDQHGRITQWREAYDLRSVTDQIAAAMA